MLQTSQKFQDDMRRLYDRRVFARIQIDYSDPEIPRDRS